MATKKRGILVCVPDWCKHLRPIGRRFFWKRERMADRRLVNNTLREKGEGRENR